MKISLLISTYNWEKALEICLLSVSRQTVLPDEIIIADDGSSPETGAMIESMKPRLNIPVLHVWHEDKGFRKTVILNKAVARSTGDYIIQVDGDVLLSKNFIKDHKELMEKGYFVCGSRTKISEKGSKKIMERKTYGYIHLLDLEPSHMPNCLRSKILRSFLSKRYGRDIGHQRGCNMAFWKEDFLKINGYDEDFIGWGHEDSDFSYRLHFSGVKKKFLKMGGTVFHLYHKENSKSNESENMAKFINTKTIRKKRCDNGIDKYLK
ncbi:glycosyltransferase family 2 protein [Porphyromonas macacae]|uniref:glycosyltransferase family 2 protein n=1 Tax=Porphyromonas macacae TaxID=28115 RepID=UPI0035A0AFEF